MLVTSTDNFASATGPTSVIPGLGGGGFSVEVDPATSTIYLAVTRSGRSGSSLYLYPFASNSATRAWTVGMPLTVQSGFGPSWSGASLALESAAAPGPYLWVGADEQSATSSYTYRAWYAPLAALAGSPTARRWARR